MSCYHPRIRIENLHKWKTAQDGHKYHPAVIEQPDDIYQRIEELKDNFWYKYTIIPCKNCIGCRLDYSKEWANRGYLEAKTHINNWFITLTYSDDNIEILDEMETKDGVTYWNDGNWTGTLVPSDLKKFLKKFRRHMEYYHCLKNIRYMACGEYGGETKRPHYHLIIFNCALPPDSFYNARIINKETYWQNTIIEKCWKQGISNISEATWNNIAYTARYITKKINGKNSEDEYASEGHIKEFFRVSLKPAIGKEYYDKHKEEIYKRDEIIIRNKQGTISIKPPKYYDKLYEKENPKHYEEIKKRRKEQAKNTNAVIDKTHSLGRLQYLEIQERTKAEQASKLKRNLEATRNHTT